MTSTDEAVVASEDGRRAPASSTDDVTVVGHDADRADFEETPAEQRSWLVRNWCGVLAFGLAALVVAPVLASGIHGLLTTWYPAGDWGMIELRTIDVGGSHTPLVGPYSRYSWNHPGPLLFWFYAIPYRVTGGNPSSLLLGAALINSAALAGTLAFAWRRGRLALLAPTAVGLMYLVHTFGPEKARDPWNAWVTVLPLALLIMATFAAAEGDRAALPVVAITGAFLTQSHIGFAVMTVVLTALAFGWSYRTRRNVRALLIGGAVVLVCWLPPLVDLVLGGPNVSRIVTRFSSGAAPAGFGRALDISSLELGLPLPWLGAPEDVNPAGGGLKGASATALIIPLVIFVAAALLARRAGARRAVRLQIVVAIAAVVGFVSVSRITDDIFDYLVRWWWSIAALGAISVAYSLWCALVAARPAFVSRPNAPLRVGAAALVLVLVLISSIKTFGKVGDAPLPIDDLTTTLGVLDHEAVPKIANDRPVLLRCTGPLCGWEYDAMAARLAANGVDVRAEDKDINRYKLGDARVVAVGDPANADRRGVWVVSGTRIDDFRRAGFGTELAIYDPLSPDERREQNDLEQQLHDVYRAAGRHDLVFQIEQGVSIWSEKPVPGLDQKVADRYDELRRRGQPVAVFVTDRADNDAPSRPAGW